MAEESIQKSLHTAGEEGMAAIILVSLTHRDQGRT
jgi:hypothetical protein